MIEFSSKRFRDYMAQNGIETVQEMANILEEPRQKVINWVTGVTKPNMDSFENCCNKLQTDPRYFFVQKNVQEQTDSNES